MQRPVVQSLLKLFTFRNNETAFDLNGSIDISTPQDNEIRIVRMNHEQTRKVELLANLEDLTYEVLANGKKLAFSEKPCLSRLRRDRCGFFVGKKL